MTPVEQLEILKFIREVEASNLPAQKRDALVSAAIALLPSRVGEDLLPKGQAS